ncbi:MAG TPA: nucleoside hydrolase [Pseudonocardiaceae bacterium]|jgi:purine nucleosidase|nr:nucleoside hydrolase [Pseudonocardiaceae bacterium]
MPKRIIMDCDPGHDDAIALVLAQGNPEVELAAVTTVAGNQTIEKVTRNALATAAVAGITGVPFAAGTHRPLVQPQSTGADIHGETGLDGPVLPAPTTELDPRHGVDLIIDTIMAEPAGTLTLVPTGPLTNIALAVRKEPRIVERVREVVLMGGAYHGGNWSPTAEFNIAVDPEAAHIVFNEPWRLTMVGLDLTHQALATPEVVERIRAIGTTAAKFVVDILGFFAESYRDVQGFDSPPVHDSCTVAYVIDPNVFTTRKAPLDVELTGGLTRGMTVADFRAAPDPDCRTSVAVKLDRERFWNLVIDAIERIGPD